MADTPLQVAILGAGGFVKDAYVKSLAACSAKIVVTGLWSRSVDSVSKLLPEIQAFSPGCRPYHGGLEEVLNSDVDAVIIVLPPQGQGAAIEAALRAGKHVLSEKPAAPTMHEAQQLLAAYRSLPQPAPLWCVAENYRSIDAFLQLRDVIASGQLGTIARLTMNVDLAMDPGNKYYSSAWRRDSTSMPGAFLTEGGVHFLAGLRMAAKASGFGEAVAAVAASAGISPDLPHPDTVAGTLWFEKGASAGYSMTMAAGRMHISLQAAGTKGCAEVVRGGIGAASQHGRGFRLVKQCAGDVDPTQVESTSNGVEEELLCFARLASGAIQQSKKAAVGTASGGAAEVALEHGGKAELPELPSEEDEYRVSCVEAVRDLAVIVALLESAAAGGARVSIAQAE